MRKNSSQIIVWKADTQNLMMTDTDKNYMITKDGLGIIKLPGVKNPNSDLVEVIEELTKDCEKMEVTIFLITDRSYTEEQIDSFDDLITQDGP